MVSLHVTLVLGWGTRLAGTGIRLCFRVAMACAHTVGGNSSKRCCEGVDVTYLPRKDGLAVRAGNSFDMPTLSNRCRSDVRCQSAAVAPAGCCFIIASIPFFISLGVGSALCVPTIHV